MTEDPSKDRKQCRHEPMAVEASLREDRNLRHRHSGSTSRLLQSEASATFWMSFQETFDECVLPRNTSFIPMQGTSKKEQSHFLLLQAMKAIATRTLLCWILAIPGLMIRFRFLSSPLALARDILSVTCENHFLLATWHCVWVESGYKGMGIMGILKWMLVLFMTTFWFFASWGDIVFETQTNGIIPRVEIIASGLANPSVHLAVQIGNPHQRNIFWGALFKVLFCLLATLALFWQHQYRHRARRKRKQMTYCDRVRSRSNSDIPFIAFFMTSRKSLCGHLTVLLFLYSVCGAWAPTTNLATAWIVSLRWKLPIIRMGGVKQTKDISTQHESIFQTINPPYKKVQKPNVIIIVHESLSGAALETTSGRDAAPWFHSTKSHGNFFHFSSARAPSGTTPIATPAILTGLLAYNRDCVDTIKRSSLTEDFKLLGYDTGSFVSYGASRWQGTSWSILARILSSKFDIIVDPQSTGEEKVNEFGMDDRKMMKYFNNWLLTRSNTTNTTASKTTMGNSTLSKPFFATVVFNNQHFPHLEHEMYSAPGCNVGGMDEGGFYFDDYTEGEGAGYSIDGDYNETYDNAFPDTFYQSYPVCRYYSSFRTMDESLKEMFGALNATGVLKNTIVIGAGDHGETPGVTKRLQDVDAPILHVPLWMHIPSQFLASRTQQDNQNIVSNGTGTSNNTVSNETETRNVRKTGLGKNERLYSTLRENTNKSVSTLDIVPTLRDLLNFPRLYTTKQQKECVTGKSLISKIIEDDQLVVGWGGTPLDGMNNGMFASKSQALLFYPRETTKSRVIDFKYNDKDPFFELYEKRFQDLKYEERLVWRNALERQDWMSSSFVQTIMSDLSSESFWRMNASSNIS